MTLARSPLKRTSGLARRTPLRSTSTLKPGKPLKRTRMRKASPRRLKRREGEAPYVAFVRSLPCAATGVNGHRCRGKREAAHATLSLNDKGTGMKVSDTQVIPLCRRAHDSLDGRPCKGGPFEGWSKWDRFEWAGEAVATCRLAAIPEDLDGALELERLGLGEVLRQVAGNGWAWHPLGATGEAAT